MRKRLKKLANIWSNNNHGMCLDIIENKEPYCLKDLAINGDILKHYGYSGKEIGIILNYCLDKVIEDKTINKEEKLLKIIREKFNN